MHLHARDGAQVSMTLTFNEKALELRSYGAGCTFLHLMLHLGKITQTLVTFIASNPLEFGDFINPVVPTKKKKKEVCSYSRFHCHC